MDRLQKKCLATSIGVHLLFLVLLLVGSAFVLPPPPPEEPVTMELVDIPDLLTDELVAPGGGNPMAASTPAPPPKPSIQRPAPEPIVKEPPPKPEVAKPAPPKAAEPEKVAEVPKPPSEKPQVKLALNNVVKITGPTADEIKERKEREAAAERAAADKARAEWEARNAEIRKLANSLNSALSGNTAVEIPGPGGAAFANYASVIRKIFKDAWRTPGEAQRSIATVVVEITITRDGTVTRRAIVTRSGFAPLDHSVQDAIDSVREVPPFPAGAKDLQRVFRINYNLDAKK